MGFPEILNVRAQFNLDRAHAAGLVSDARWAQINALESPVARRNVGMSALWALIPCPTCGKPVGTWCREGADAPNGPHPERLNATWDVIRERLHLARYRVTYANGAVTFEDAEDATQARAQAESWGGGAEVTTIEQVA